METRSARPVTLALVLAALAGTACGSDDVAPERARPAEPSGTKLVERAEKALEHGPTIERTGRLAGTLIVTPRHVEAGIA
jgi:hypothetical protein